MYLKAKCVVQLSINKGNAKCSEFLPENYSKTGMKSELFILALGNFLGKNSRYVALLLLIMSAGNLLLVWLDVVIVRE